MLPSEVFPDAPRRCRRGKPEKKVQKEVVRWLVEHGVILAVTDAGTLYGAACGIPAGWPDITSCTPIGRFLGVECKAKKGKQSDDQKAMQSRIEANGGIYVVAHSLDELIIELRKEELCDKPTGISLEKFGKST